MNNDLRRPACLLLCALTFSIAAVPFSTEAMAKIFLSREDAMEKTFGSNARFERETIFPTPEQLTAARTLAGSGVTLSGAPLTRYVSTRDGKVLGFAYLDSHKVRTLRQTVMIFVTVGGALDKIEILTFGEPEEYIARKIWLRQFPNRELDDDLNIGRKIHGMSGATLTAHAVTDAARRILALHKALERSVQNEEPSP